MNWKGRYAHGYEQGRLHSLQEFERVLAILREELADLKRDRDYQMQRADAAADLLLQHLGARAISLAGKAEETERLERKVRTVTALTSIPDPTEELPYDHPSATYRSAAEASIFPPRPRSTDEDVASVEG